MKIPTVTQCCCGVKLRTAGIIFGVLGILICGSELFTEQHLWKQIYLGIWILVEIFWLFGIFKDTPIFLLPSLFLNVIETIIMLFAPLYLTQWLHWFVPEVEDLLIKYKEYYVSVYIFICVVIYITLAFVVYILIVSYSLYKQISDKRAGVRAFNDDDHSIKYGP